MSAAFARIRCLHCREQRDYYANGVRLTLHPDGRIIMRFFCTACYELNAQETNGGFAEELTNMGVPTLVIGTPLEVKENLALRAGPPLSELDVSHFEDQSLAVFNRFVAHELGQRS